METTSLAKNTIAIVMLFVLTVLSVNILIGIGAIILVGLSSITNNEQIELVWPALILTMIILILLYKPYKWLIERLIMLFKI